MHLSRSVKRILVSLLCALIVCVVVYGGIQVYMVRLAAPYLCTPANAPQAQAALILGARVYANGNISPLLQDRLDYGYQLYAAGKVDKLLVSGDHGTAEYNEVRAMKDYLLGRGVPAEDIFMDHAGFDTYDSLYRARDVFQVESLIICTQEFHMARAIFIGRSLGMEAWGYAAADKAIYKMRYNQARESLARVKSFAETKILHRAPHYLGELMPITGSGLVTDDLI